MKVHILKRVLIVVLILKHVLLRGLLWGGSTPVSLCINARRQQGKKQHSRDNSFSMIHNSASFNDVVKLISVDCSI